MIIKCPACEQKNRLDPQRISEHPKCGACKTVIDYYAYPANVSSAEFDSVVKNADVPVVVDFWSPTCGPCLMAAPELEKFAQSHPKHLVLKINAQKYPAILQRFGIKGVPTFKTFKGGEVVKTEVGFLDAKQMGEKLTVAK